jgi:hypothetical protein
MNKKFELNRQKHEPALISTRSLRTLHRGSLEPSCRTDYMGPEKRNVRNVARVVSGANSQIPMKDTQKCPLSKSIQVRHDLRIQRDPLCLRFSDNYSRYTHVLPGPYGSQILNSRIPVCYGYVVWQVSCEYN